MRYEGFTSFRGANIEFESVIRIKDEVHVSNSFTIFSVVFNPCPVKRETIVSSGCDLRTYLLIPAVVEAAVGSM